MKTEEVLCEAEDLVKGRERLPAVATKQEPLNRYRRYCSGDEDQQRNTDSSVISLFKYSFDKTNRIPLLLSMLCACIVG